jgi:hypothetical protein
MYAMPPCRSWDHFIAEPDHPYDSHIAVDAVPSTAGDPAHAKEKYFGFGGAGQAAGRRRGQGDQHGRRSVTGPL